MPAVVGLSLRRVDRSLLSGTMKHSEAVPAAPTREIEVILRPAMPEVPRRRREMRAWRQASGLEATTAR